jgi:hypothetical protein
MNWIAELSAYHRLTPRRSPSLNRRRSVGQVRVTSDFASMYSSLYSSRGDSSGTRTLCVPRLLSHICSPRPIEDSDQSRTVLTAWYSAHSQHGLPADSSWNMTAPWFASAQLRVVQVRFSGMLCKVVRAPSRPH